MSQPEETGKGHEPQHDRARSGPGFLGTVAGTVLLVSVGLFYLGDAAFVIVLDKPEEAKWEKARSDMTEISRALNMHATESGQYPASLSAIEHVFGGQLPTDPFTGQQFKYSQAKDNFELTSLGADKVQGGTAAPEKDIVFNRFGPVE